MKKHYSTSYFLKQAFTGLWRNGVMSIASVAVLMSCLVVLGCFAALVVNINVNLDNIAELNEIMVYCEYELDDEAVEKVGKEIDSLELVKKSEHITKDQALEDLKNSSGDHSDIYDDMSGENNPLCESFKVEYAAGTEAAKVYDLESQLRSIEGVRKISSVYQTAKTIDSFKNGVMLVAVWFLVILFVVSIFVIINTIRLAVYSRRHEISVMRYVGATNRFITLPFIFEGVIIGVVAAAIAYFIEMYLYIYIEGKAADSIQIISVLPFENLAIPLAAGFLAVGIITGVIGSIVSIRKNLKS